MRDVTTECYKLELSTEVRDDIEDARSRFSNTRWEENECLAALTIYCAKRHGFDISYAQVSEVYNAETSVINNCLKDIISQFDISQAEYVQEIVNFSSYKKSFHSTAK
jgi:hypothetical protein